MKKLYPLVLISIIAVACGGESANNVLLSGSVLFNADSVIAFLSNATASQADSSKKYFLHAIDYVKNKNDAAASIPLFIKSLGVYPTASAYYQLGDAYLSIDSAALALEAFKMAERLDYSPFGNVLFKEACCYAALGDDKTTDYLKYAIENGFVNREEIFNDKWLAKYDNNNQRIEPIYNEAMAGNGEGNAILWQGFSRQFQQAIFPLVIDSGTYKSMGQRVAISYDYDRYIAEMRDDKFSRDVGNDYFYFAKVIDTTAFKTVIYGVQPYETGSGPAYYFLASFNNQGRLVDKKIVAGTKTFTGLFNVLSMASAQAFQIQAYKNIYQKDIEKEGFDDNPVIKRELVSTTAYTIDSTGRFIEVPLK